MTWTFDPASGVNVVVRNPIRVTKKNAREASSQVVLGGEPTIFDMALGPSEIEVVGELYGGLDSVDTLILNLEGLRARSKQPITITGHKARYNGDYIMQAFDYDDDVNRPNVIIWTMRLQKVL